MKKITLVIPLLLMLACESTPDEPQFEPEIIECPVELDLCCESKEGSFFIYTAPAESCVVSIVNMDNDLDLTVGEYDESDQFKDQIVLAVSKNPGVQNETVEIVTLPGKEYLIEVFNYGHDTACGTLIVEYEETDTK